MNKTTLSLNILMVYRCLLVLHILLAKQPARSCLIHPLLPTAAPPFLPPRDSSSSSLSLTLMSDRDCQVSLPQEALTTVAVPGFSFNSN
uniref:Uncharacterized protein n=1 Tax=Oryza brachyantha TaxID=4533 RepID=J3MHL9_ORYBR